MGSRWCMPTNDSLAAILSQAVGTLWKQPSQAFARQEPVSLQDRSRDLTRSLLESGSWSNKFHSNSGSRHFSASSPPSQFQPLRSGKNVKNLTMEKTQMHGAWNDTVQCSQWGQKEPHKAKLLQDAPFSKQKHCHTAHVAQKQASLYGMRYP